MKHRNQIDASEARAGAELSHFARANSVSRVLCLPRRRRPPDSEKVIQMGKTNIARALDEPHEVDDTTDIDPVAKRLFYIHDRKWLFHILTDVY